MRILDPTLTYSNLAVKTQSHHPVLSPFVVADIEKYLTHGNYHSYKF